MYVINKHITLDMLAELSQKHFIDWSFSPKILGNFHHVSLEKHMENSAVSSLILFPTNTQ